VTHQDADASAWNGNISAGDADNATAGDIGGTAYNLSISSNTGTSGATLATSPASATNSAGIAIGQTNSGGASRTAASWRGRERRRSQGSGRRTVGAGAAGRPMRDEEMLQAVRPMATPEVHAKKSRS